MNVLIVGDSCKDVFIYGDITRLSPEAPVPVFNPRRTIENDGDFTFFLNKDYFSE